MKTWKEHLSDAIGDLHAADMLTAASDVAKMHLLDARENLKMALDELEEELEEDD